MKNIIAVDIDGTISLIGNRLKYIQQTPKDWDSFYSKCYEDKPNIPVIEILKGLIKLKQYYLVYVTGRPERIRFKTQQWIIDNALPCFSAQLFMRNEGDYRPDYIIKTEIIKPFKDRIFMAFEDRDQVVKMYRNLEIPCMQVTEGNY